MNGIWRAIGFSLVGIVLAAAGSPIFVQHNFSQASAPIVEHERNLAASPESDKDRLLAAGPESDKDRYVAAVLPVDGHDRLARAMFMEDNRNIG